MIAYLEHANITVPDVDAAISFLKIVEPAFEIRHDKAPDNSYRWAHIGTDECYIALEEPHSGLISEQTNPRTPYHDFGVNHLAWVVEDLDAVIRRLEEHGYQKGIPVEPHPHRKRAYYHDASGVEWEIIEYLSDDPAERNAYD